MTDYEDRMFADWLREGPDRGPADGPERVFERTRAMRQRPSWTFVSRWAPVAWPERRILATVVAVALLLLAVAAAILLVGSPRHRGAPLTGPAPNGMLVWDTGFGGQVFIADNDGSNPRPILGAEPITRSPSFSRDGLRLVFWSRANTDDGTPLELWGADADGTNVHRIATGLDTNVFAVADWSPDGRHLVYGAMDGDVWRLYLASFDGSEPTRAITGTDASRDEPIFSPDGKWIAFRKVLNGPAPMESYSVIAADGSGVERDLHSQPLPDNGGPAAGPIWAPDSSAIAYGRMGDPARAGMSASPREFPDHAYLAIQPLAGGPDRVIYGDLLGSMGWPAWSPDGQWLAVTVGSEEFSRAVVMRSDGSDRKTLLPRNAQPGLECGGVGWAPDGQSLLYGCGQVLRYFLDDLDHPEPMPVPSTVGWLGWQRDPGR